MSPPIQKISAWVYFDKGEIGFPGERPLSQVEVSLNPAEVGVINTSLTCQAVQHGVFPGITYPVTNQVQQHLNSDGFQYFHIGKGAQHKVIRPRNSP